MVRIPCVIVLAFGALAAGLADAGANTVGCGGNSVSYAEVARPRAGARARARHAPLQALPDSLCADLVEERPRQIESLHLSIDPRATQQPTDLRPQP
jgi:hypothetical protein